MCFPHDWKWEPPRWVRSVYVQYGSTSITDAGGLAKFLGLVIERAHWQALNADDET